MRRKTRWYIHPIVLAVVGIAVFLAVHDIQIPKTTVEKEISYDRLQK